MALLYHIIGNGLYAMVYFNQKLRYITRATSHGNKWILWPIELVCGKLELEEGLGMKKMVS